SLSHRVDVAGNSIYGRHHRPGPQPLYPAECDQRTNIPGGGTGSRANEKNDDPENQDALPAEYIGELAVYRDRDGLGEQIDGKYPGEFIKPAKIGYNLGNSR